MREQRTERKTWLLVLLVYTRVYVEEEREGEGNEVRCRRDMPQHQDSIESAGALVRISNTDRIQGIFLGVSTQPTSVSDPRMMTRQCTGRTQSAVAEWSD